LLTEIIATACLIVVGFSFGSKSLGPTGLAPGFSPWFWGVLVWVIGLSLGGPTGYAINPARDFAPRVAHAVLPIPAKGSSDWRYALVPILGPLIGAALAAFIIKWVGII
jgi:glycerol uptake facilitator protein